MKSAIDDPIATESMVLTTADGERKTITVMVGRPYADGEAFRCPVKVTGLEPQYVDIAGETSLQALCLALRLVRQRLEHQLETGSSLLYPDQADSEDADTVELGVLVGWSMSPRLKSCEPR